MEKKVANKLKVDIENAEKFFDRTGESLEDAFKCIDEDEYKRLDKAKEDGIKNVFLYIPNAYNDIYALFLN
jgi:hypothetical protein